MTFLEDYYSNYNEEGRLLSQHGQVEYRTTMKYIREALAGDKTKRILEVGAGTGRYCVTLAKEGFPVTAVELVAHNLEILKSKLDGTEDITALQGNALDLSRFPDESFDLTLVLGRHPHGSLLHERAHGDPVRLRPQQAPGGDGGLDAHRGLARHQPTGGPVRNGPAGGDRSPGRGPSRGAAEAGGY